MRGFLEEQKKGIRVGTIYAHIDADLGSADARNKRDKDENATALEAFRNDQLDVLINIRMLTEGTDVPKVETVFLTRQTTSKILLTQMVGRALRGPEFGGKDKAYIVSFIDNWQPGINWAEYDPLEETPTIDDVPKPSERLPMQLISIDMVRRLIEKINIGVVVNDVPFLTFMPIGWYRVEFEIPTGGSGDTEIVQRLVMVFENEKASYERFIKHLKTVNLEGFIEVDVNFESQRHRIEDWQKQFFSDVEEHIGGDLLANLFHIALHKAQKENVPPNWFYFEQRQDHNLDDVAQKFIDARLNRWEEDEKLNEEYHREDRYWKIIYYRYELFKSQYNACVEWILANIRRGTDPRNQGSTFKGIKPPDDEPSDEIKEQVKKRDSFRCLCCSENNIRLLQVDHINPKHHGGDHSLDNLQILCDTCNRMKGTTEIDFRKHQTSLKESLSNFPDLELPKLAQAGDPKQWEQFLHRSTNFFYQCAAVKSVQMNNRGIYIYPWEICIHADNHPRWLKPHLEEL